jgi:hypothetical protein
MSVELLEEAPTKAHEIIEIQVTGKLTKEDYRRFVPRIEEMIAQHGKVRILFEMLDFHGWKAGALWEDVKFDFKHFSDIDRVAIVGNQRWQKVMVIFCKPFTAAKVHFFDFTRLEEARSWLRAET